MAFVLIATIAALIVHHKIVNSNRGQIVKIPTRNKEG